MRHLLIITFLLAAVISNSQPPIQGEWRKLGYRIGVQLHLNDSLTTEDFKPEYVLCILKADSSGKISSVHYQCDPKNIGYVYKSLSVIPLSAFDGWEYEKAKGRTIIIPFFYCPKQDCPDYINDLVNSRGDKLIFWKIINETPTTILFTAMRLFRQVDKY